MSQTITIQPITRIEGHASIKIWLDDAGNYQDARVNYMSLRGFEKFVEGKPAEELPDIVCRICGICPWMHHLASNKAVDRCFGVTPTPAGHKLRELMQTIAHAEDKLLHFYFLAAPDFVIGPDADYAVRNVVGIAKANPELATQVVKMRYLVKMILDKFSRKTIHPIAGVPGGFCKPMLEEERQDILAKMRQVLDFALFTIDFAKKNVFPKYLDAIKTLGVITTGFIGTVDENGAHNLYDGKIRLMKADGSYVDFDAQDYADYLGEHVEPWSYGKFPYARKWNEGFRPGRGPAQGDLPGQHARADQRGRPNGDPAGPGRAGGVPLAVRPAGPGDPALPLRPADRGSVRLRAGHRDPGRPGHHGHQRARQGRAQGRARGRLRRGAARDADPRLLHRRERPHHARQHDRGHHAQPGAHEPEREAGGARADP